MVFIVVCQWFYMDMYIDTFSMLLSMVIIGHILDTTFIYMSMAFHTIPYHGIIQANYIFHLIGN